jgi:excisionase family DNA binding protein
MLITIRLAAELLKVTEQTAYYWARTDRIPGVLKIGRTIRIDEDQIKDFIRRGGNRGLGPADVQRYQINQVPAREHAGGSARNDAGGPIPAELSLKALKADLVRAGAEGPETWMGRHGEPRPDDDHN